MKLLACGSPLLLHRKGAPLNTHEQAVLLGVLGCRIIASTVLHQANRCRHLRTHCQAGKLTVHDYIDIETPIEEAAGRQAAALPQALFSAFDVDRSKCQGVWHNLRLSHMRSQATCQHPVSTTCKGPSHVPMRQSGSAVCNWGPITSSARDALQRGKKGEDELYHPNPETRNCHEHFPKPEKFAALRDCPRHSTIM